MNPGGSYCYVNSLFLLGLLLLCRQFEGNLLPTVKIKSYVGEIVFCKSGLRATCLHEDVYIESGS